MTDKKNTIAGRRRFLKNACGAGAGLVATAAGLRRPWSAGAATEPPEMPRRTLGRTGVSVPILGLGGSLDLTNQQLLLRQALKMGVTYWDTADSYSGGRSEAGIGKYFSTHPEDRRRVFLVSKTGSATPERMTADLTASLKRLNTDTLDLYLLHGVHSVTDEVSDITRRWAAAAKAEGRIRFFGFSTHRNMADCLSQAARLGWIDAVMFTYNYRLMADGDMTRAMDACAGAGIGLMAMKTQGRWSVFSGANRGDELVQGFLERGMTQHQARLKAVWENPQIAGICSHMDTLAILKENVAAAVDGKRLTKKDRALLNRHARLTAAGYCTGCSHVCESRLTDPIPVADVMRCLMYAHGYNDYQMARGAFSRLPADLAARISMTDFSAAENHCPQRMAIGELLRKAATEMG